MVTDQGVLLHRHWPERGMHRWYRVVVTQDIFGAWTAACFWGSTLNRFQQHRLVYAGSEAEAREKARRIVKKKKARGYGEIEC